MRDKKFTAAMSAALAWAGLAAFPAQSQTAPACNYCRLREPPVKPQFLTLPITAIKPKGWLLEWGQTLKGQLLNGNFNTSDPNHPGGFWLEDKDNGGWQAEAESYWIEGLTKAAYLLDDKQLMDSAMKRIEAVFHRVNATGDLNPNGRGDGWGNYFDDNIGWSMQAYYSATHDQRVLDAWSKAYMGRDTKPNPWQPPKDSAGHPFWPESQIHEWRSDYSVEELTEFYSLGADKALLDYAIKELKDKENGPVEYLGRRKDFSNLWEHGFSITGYEMVYLIGYMWTGNPDYLKTAMNLIEFLKTYEEQPHGAITSGEWFNGTGAFKRTEVCGTIPHIVSQAWFLRIFGDRAWGDAVEKAIFNAALGEIDDRHYLRYFSAPNTIPASYPCKHGVPCEYPSVRTDFEPVNAVGCCLGSSDRLWVNYVDKMWMATYDNGLAATFYGPSNLAAMAGAGVQVQIAEETNYPWEDTISLTVNPQQGVHFPLYLRMPGWVEGGELQVNGAPQPITLDSRGFIKLDRDWKAGDKVRLRFPLKPRVVVSRELDLDVNHRQYFADNAGNGRGCYAAMPCSLTYTPKAPYASVYRGPVLYGLPITSFYDTTGWQKALVFDPKDPATSFSDGAKVTGFPGGAENGVLRWPMKTLQPTSLSGKGMKFTWSTLNGQEEFLAHFHDPLGCHVKMPDSALPLDQGKVVDIQLVPYGSTEMQISMFPVVQGTSIPNTPVALEAAPRPAVDLAVEGLAGRALRLRVPGPGYDRAELLSVNGKVLSAASCRGLGAVELRGANHPGLYLLRLAGSQGNLVKAWFRAAP